MWEGIFKSQALLDEAAVIACMVYVDLNPIRAKMASTPESSHHTSIQKRINAVQTKQNQPKHLLPFVGNPRQEMPKGMAFSLKGYCELVDTTGRIIRKDKAGAIKNNQSPILERLNIPSEHWLTLTTEFEQHFSNAVGSEHMLRQFGEHTHHKRIRGIKQANTLFKSA